MESGIKIRVKDRVRVRFRVRVQVRAWGLKAGKEDKKRQDGECLDAWLRIQILGLSG